MANSEEFEQNIDNNDAYQIIHLLDDAFDTAGQPEEKTEEQYSELQRNLILYKSGDTEACTYIVSAFHKFITKYARFICLGHVPRYEQVNKKTGKTFLKIDPTIVSFVGLYVSKKVKEECTSKSKRFHITCDMIKEMFAKYEYADIYNELVLALFNMVERYKITKEGDQYHKRNGTFPMYVQKCFHWEAKRCLDKLIEENFIQPVNFSCINDFVDDDEVNPIEEWMKDESAEFAFIEGIESANRDIMLKNTDKLTMKETEKIDVYTDDALNFNWTNGATCSEIFAELTPFEREILILLFIKKQSLDQVAKLYGYNKITIKRYRDKTIEKLKTQSEKLGIRIWD